MNGGERERKKRASGEMRFNSEAARDGDLIWAVGLGWTGEIRTVDLGYG